MAKRRTADDLAWSLDRLDDPRSPESAALLRRALEGGSFVAARAAEIVREHELPGFDAALVAAFDRLLAAPDPVAADPQCRAKTAIVDALAAVEYRDSDFFLRHIGYRQHEPVWGGSVDTAAHLRGLCGHGLVQSGHRRPMKALIDLLADLEKSTRQDAAQALGLTGREEAAFVLRTKLLCGDSKPEVVGDCFASLLSLTPADGVPFVARFLDVPSEDVRLEAAAALGGSTRPEAVAALVGRWRTERSEPLREAILLAIGSGRQPAGIEFLLSIVEKEAVRTASQALTALAPCRFYPDLRRRIGEAVERRDSATLSAQFRKEFADR